MAHAIAAARTRLPPTSTESRVDFATSAFARTAKLRTTSYAPAASRIASGATMRHVLGPIVGIFQGEASWKSMTRPVLARVVGWVRHVCQTAVTIIHRMALRFWLAKSATGGCAIGAVLIKVSAFASLAQLCSSGQTAIGVCASGRRPLANSGTRLPACWRRPTGSVRQPAPLAKRRASSTTKSFLPPKAAARGSAAT